MSITKSQNARVMSEEAIQYLCKCINLVNSLPTSVIDNLHLADNLTFSSTKIDSLLTTLKKDCNKYTDSIVANLSRLELKVVTNEADMNEHNKLYLIKKASETSYSQYVIVTNDTGVDEKILLGTCDISMTDYLKITDADSTYCKKTDFNSLVTEVTNLKTEIGSGALTTTSTNLSGAVNELNSGKIDKTSITTTISSTSTDEEVPSALALYNKTKNMCTTSVEDTSGTVTLPDGVAGNIAYKIINGICYVSVQRLADGLTGGQVPAFTGLPKASIYVNTDIESSGYRVGSIYSDDGVVFNVHKISDSGGYGSFSYPVAES